MNKLRPALRCCFLLLGTPTLEMDKGEKFCLQARSLLRKLFEIARKAEGSGFAKRLKKGKKQEWLWKWFYVAHVFFFLLFASVSRVARRGKKVEDISAGHVALSDCVVAGKKTEQKNTSEKSRKDSRD